MKSVFDDYLRALSEHPQPSVTAADKAAAILSGFAEVRRDKMGGVVATIAGDSRYTILLDAHIDEIAFTVIAIDEKGFLKIDKVGGVDIRVLPGAEVTVWGQRPLYGVFCSTPPHLNKDTKNEARPIEEAAIDIGYTHDQASALVSLGDRVTFCQSTADLLNDRITGKALDDRAGVAALCQVAKKIAQSGKKPPCTVIIQLSEQEEVGGRGAIIDAFAQRPDEAVAVDVSFGQAPGVPKHKSGRLGGGLMLGVAASLSSVVTARLEELAHRMGLSCPKEIMGGKTGTNADYIAISRAGIPCGLLSIPLRNMHTPVEVVERGDVRDVADLLYEYVMTGGCMERFSNSYLA